jgi:cytidylate kinase
VICISRVTGAGGEDVGRLVAKKLGLRYLDDEIIARAAEKGGVSAADVADAERRKSTLGRLLSELGSGTGAEAWAVTGIAPVVSDERPPAYLPQLVVDVVEEVAGHGDVVIAAHGASFALAGRTDVLRVHVTASPETRARRLSESAELEPRAAAKTISDSDRSRADYLRRFYGIKAELPTQYDLVLNSDRLSSVDMAELVAHAAGVSR